MSDTTRPDYVAEQYRDDRNLKARQSIYAFQRPVTDIWGTSLDLAQLCGAEKILDVGCGNGLYLGALRGRRHRGLVCGCDLSVGMLESARPLAGAEPLLNADAQALPFADGAFDVVMAMHMLYHVPDRTLAIAELRRVLRHDGVALVVTNSTRHFEQLDDLLVECALAVTGVERMPVRAHISFTMESGPDELAAVFPSVEARLLESELIVDEVEPVVDYARSMSAFVSDDEHELDGVLDELRRRVSTIIRDDGAFHVRSASGCLVCR